MFKAPLGPHKSATVTPNTLQEGDPDDRSLNFFERRFLVPEKIRNRAKDEKCINELQEFNTCVKASNLFNCVSKNRTLKKCIGKWCNDKDFIQYCTEEYLDERSYFRLLNSS